MQLSNRCASFAKNALTDIPYKRPGPGESLPTPFTLDGPVNRATAHFGPSDTHEEAPVVKKNKILI